MALHGPILIIEDDADDTEVISAAIKELGAENALLKFTNAEEALEYLLRTTDRPLFILCDVMMPRLNGLDLLKQISLNEYLKKKAIPFIFFTNAAGQEIVDEAYLLGVQGFFKKAGSFNVMKEQLYAILMYWNRCLHPNSGLGGHPSES